MLAPHLSARWSSHLNELAKYHFADWKKGKQGEIYLVEKNELNDTIATKRPDGRHMSLI